MTALARSERVDLITTAMQRVMDTDQYMVHQSAVDAAGLAVDEAKEALREAEEAASAPGASKRAINLVGFSQGELDAASEALTLAEAELCAFVAEETERQVKALEDAAMKPAPATNGADIVLNDPPCELCVEKGRVCQRQPNRPTSVACFQCVRRSIACSLVPGPKRSRKRQSDVISDSPRAYKRKSLVEKATISGRAQESFSSEGIDLLRRIDRRTARNARNMTLLMFKICETQNMELPLSWEEHSDSDGDDEETDG